MRHSPVALEKLYWARLRDRRLGGYKFRRQYLIGPYITDFVCTERKLVVELDGPLHDTEYDRRRDAYLRRLGYRVIRIKNADSNEAQFTRILGALRVPLTPTLSPSGGEGELPGMRPLTLPTSTFRRSDRQ
jgi:very-short-patch-repair endonuclease